jgi:pre-mRNA-splicing factor ATP-dependent RNA helicase DHX15/PRP43
MLLASFDEGCVEEALTIGAMLNVRRIFLPVRRTREARQRADAALAEFAAREGDHITMLNVYADFEAGWNETRRDRTCQDLTSPLRNDE